MKRSALFLLAAAALSGCSTVESIRSGIRDSQRPQEEGADALQYKKLFEAGRRAERKGDVRIAGDTYGWLIGRGSRYGEYGLATLILRREPGSAEAAKNLIACAKRSSHTSALFPDSAMDSAFSAAAMARLSVFAASERGRTDLAESLRAMMSGVVTPQVRAWAEGMKADAETAEIYEDVIAAVELSRREGGYARAPKWSEISEAILGGGGGGAKGGGAARPSGNGYSVVRFVKVPDATCQYDFEVRLEGDATFETGEKVRSAIRRQLVKEFLAANPHDGVEDVRTAFVSWNQSAAAIKGSAVVMKVSAVRLEYDAATRRGKIAVRLDGRDLSAARKWALDNIAELATGKNIALVTGRLPPDATYYSLGESVKDGNILEIEFKTE